jgi:hypothetical protein
MVPAGTTDTRRRGKGWRLWSNVHRGTQCRTQIKDAMSLSSSWSPASIARLARIRKALEELNRCVSERGQHGKSWGLTIGECDWRAELHDALYGDHVSDNPRKNYPVATGVLDYFPDALLEIARVSKIGNDQHHPGQPLHWDRAQPTKRTQQSGTSCSVKR